MFQSWFIRGVLTFAEVKDHLAGQISKLHSWKMVSSQICRANSIFVLVISFQVLINSAQKTYHLCTEEAMRCGLQEHCKLPDTFQSWFLLTHLHLWMCMVRAKQEHKEGHYVCQQMVSMFWYDVEHRMKLLGVSLLHSFLAHNEPRKHVNALYSST